MNNFEKVKEIFNEKFTLDMFESGDTYPYMCDIIRRIKNGKDYNDNSFCTDKCSKCYEWLKQEYKEPILTESEKEYLSAVIKPWIDRVESIVKYNYDGKQFIQIAMRDSRDIDLPFFEAGSMYKGMVVGKKYSLEELKKLLED